MSRFGAPAEPHWRVPGPGETTVASTREEPGCSEAGLGGPAVHLVDGAGDVGGLLGGQERDEVAQLDRLAEAAERNARGRGRQLRLERLILLGAAPRAGGDAGGEERPRQHQVDGDAV